MILELLLFPDEVLLLLAKSGAAAFFMFVILLGSLFVLPNFLTFFLVFCAATGFATEAYLEEQFLLSKFGDVYKGYMTETGRFIPKNFL